MLTPTSLTRVAKTMEAETRFEPWQTSNGKNAAFLFVFDVWRKNPDSHLASSQDESTTGDAADPVAWLDPVPQGVQHERAEHAARDSSNAAPDVQLEAQCRISALFFTDHVSIRYLCKTTQNKACIK